MQNPSSCSPADASDNPTNQSDVDVNLLSQLRQAVCRRCDDIAASATSDATSTNHESDKQQQSQQVCQALLQDTAHLQRILVARQHDIEKSADLIMEQVRFRIKWNPLQITPEMIPHALPSGAFRLCGYSKEGHVMVNFKLRYWNPKAYGVVNNTTVTTTPSRENDLEPPTTDQQQPQSDDNGLHDAVQEFVRYVVYMMELSLGYMHPPPMPDRLVVLFDLRGFSLSLVLSTRVRRMISRLIYVAQAQYPERLEKVYLLHAPYGFATAWQLLRPLLDERTAHKVQFASVSQLEQDIDPNVLSEDYGGNHPEYPLPTKTLEDEWQAIKGDDKSVVDTATTDDQQ